MSRQACTVLCVTVEIGENMWSQATEDFPFGWNLPTNRNKRLESRMYSNCCEMGGFPEAAIRSSDLKLSHHPSESHYPN